MLVKADELVRKPFQPQDLIARVKSLLNPNPNSAGSMREEEENAARAASRVLSGLFSPAPTSAPTYCQQPPEPSLRNLFCRHAPWRRLHIQPPQALRRSVR